MGGVEGDNGNDDDHGHKVTRATEKEKSIQF